MNVGLDAAQVKAIVYRRVVAYVNAGSFCILFYDFFLTLASEITTIWVNPKWNYTKLVYIITRYSTFVEAGVVLYQQAIPGDWYGACEIAYKTNAMLFVFGLGTGEIIMTMRTWAVWGMGRSLAYSLLIFYLLIWAGGFAVTGRFMTSVKFAPTPISSYIGCYPSYADRIIFISWVLLLIYDAVMFVLIMIPALRSYRRGGNSRLLHKVYSDGIVYYLYLFTLSLINILVSVLAPRDLAFLFSVLSRVLHAILSCRVVLHIAEHGRESTEISELSIPNPLSLRLRKSSRTESQQQKSSSLMPSSEFYA